MVDCDQESGVYVERDNGDCLEEHAEHGEVVVLVNLGSQLVRVSDEDADADVVAEAAKEHAPAVRVLVAAEVVQLRVKGNLQWLSLIHI